MSAGHELHPRWDRLLAEREGALDRGSAAPAGWSAALAHLDGCAACRREAFARDPLLVFQRMAPVEETATDASEAASMKSAVAAMRRARRVSGPATEPAAAAGGRSWSRLAAAAGLVAALGGSYALLPDGAGGPAERLALRVDPVAESAFAESAAAAQPEAPPVVESLDRPDASVYQLGGEGLAVVMIVDSGLDV